MSAILKAILSSWLLSGRSLSDMCFIRQLFHLTTGPTKGPILTIDDGGIHGAPRPIAGAGLPTIAIGFGACWLFRRYRRMPRPTARIAHDAKLEFSSKDRRKLGHL